MRLIWRSRERWLKSAGIHSPTGRLAGARFFSLLRAAAARILPGRLRGQLSITTSGPTLLLAEGFDDSNVGARGWYDFNPLTISATEHHNGAGSLQTTFTSGTTAPSWTALRHVLTPTDTLYVSFWVKYASNWVGSGQLYHPHEFYILSDRDNDAAGGDFSGLSDNYLTTYIEHNYQAGGIPRFFFQDSKNINTGASLFRTGSGTVVGTDPVANTESRSIGGANGGVENGWFWESFSNPGSATGYYNDKRLSGTTIAAGTWRNTWNHVEAYFAMNSVSAGVGQHDGIVRYWFNGAIQFEATNVLLRTGANPTLKFKQLVIAPYIGDGSPVTQTCYYDDLVVLTGRPTAPLRGTLRTL